MNLNNIKSVEKYLMSVLFTVFILNIGLIKVKIIAATKIKLNFDINILFISIFYLFYHFSCIAIIMIT